MLRFEILQVCMQHPKEKIDIVRRLRNFENALVNLRIRRRESVSPPNESVLCADPWRIGKSNPQSQFFCDEIDRAQSQGKLLQKATQHKEQRLGRFNFVFKFEAFLECLRRSDQFEQPIGLPVRPFPHSHRFRTKPGTELLLIKCGELSESMNPPLVQDL